MSPQAPTEKPPSRLSAKTRSLFTRPAFWFFLFAFVLILFNYPFLSAGRPWTGSSMYFYFFTVWAAIIFFCACIGFSLPKTEEREPDDS